MSDDTSDIHARLDELGEKIKAHKAKLELHGLFEQDHQLTEKELRDRWAELKSEVESQVHEKGAADKKVDWLQSSIMKWVDALDLDFKS